MPKKRVPPAGIVDPLAPKRPNPSKFVAKALTVEGVAEKAAKKAAKKRR